MIFNSGKYDRQHKKDIKRIQMAVKQLLDDAIARGVVIALGTGFDGTLKEMFDFDDFPIAKRLMDELLEEMHGNIYHTIAEGNKTAIDLSNLKNDTMVLSVAAGGTDKIYKIADDILNGTAEYSIPKEWLDHNLVKADAFNNRVVNGMNLSDRVWNITDSFYEDLRMAVDEGMKSGKSAQSLSREVRQLLKEPGNLYRRVRNRYGKLVPSKRMRRKKTGKGVYKSSYKNALRLAGTETNIAYRTADHERWNALPFVEGIEISVSHTNHTVPDICDELAGVYPKSFKFVGWHPNCRCYAVAKLPSVEDYEKYREAMANGTDDEFEFDEVTELPDNFKEWYANNEDKINSAKNVPYFIQDNFKKEDGKFRGIKTEEENEFKNAPSNYEKTYINRETNGYVLTEKSRIKLDANMFSKNDIIKYKKEKHMCVVLADNGYKIKHLSEEPGVSSSDITLNNSPADLKSVKNGNNIVKYAKKAVHKQGAEYVVFEIEDENDKVYSELHKLKEKGIKCLYYFTGKEKVNVL